jgi:hypothetical protein
MGAARTLVAEEAADAGPAPAGRHLLVLRFALDRSGNLVPGSVHALPRAPRAAWS